MKLSFFVFYVDNLQLCHVLFRKISYVMCVFKGFCEELEKLDEVRKNIVKEEKQLLSDLAGLRNRPILEAMTTDVVYGLSVHSYKQWKAFLR